MLKKNKKESTAHYALRVLWRIIKKIISYTSYVKYYLVRPKLKPGNNEPPITISFTTYPARVKWLPIVVGSIVRQKRRPDRIVLYLSKSQFSTLNKRVFKLISKQGVQIKLKDDDLRSHKKYIYAMNEYSNDIIITIDDDIVYDKNMIDDLYQSYRRHPNAVSAKRVHRIKFTDDKEPKPYKEWDIATQEIIDKPSFQLVATGCGGILYPPNCLDDRFIDVQTIKKTCLYADDLWLKIMELFNNTPVVLATSYRHKLEHVWNTECDGLALDNVGSRGNDVQLQNICEHYEANLYTLVQQLK